MSEQEIQAIVITRETTVTDLLALLLRHFAATGKKSEELHFEVTTDGVPARLLIAVSLEPNPEGIH